MTEWVPATEAESAMRDALRAGDQEQYFRILSRIDLLLPVSADALAGRAPIGWGTWTSGKRTHVLAFSSPEAMAACLAENAGSARRISYQELASNWPNHDWWLAVNPGLPIEGYLPAWFVAQLARGDVRVPSQPPPPRDRMERVESFQRTVTSPSRRSALPSAELAESPANPSRSLTGTPLGRATVAGAASVSVGRANVPQPGSTLPVAQSSNAPPGGAPPGNSPSSGTLAGQQRLPALPRRIPRPIEQPMDAGSGVAPPGHLATGSTGYPSAHATIYRSAATAYRSAAAGIARLADPVAPIRVEPGAYRSAEPSAAQPAGYPAVTSDTPAPQAAPPAPSAQQPRLPDPPKPRFEPANEVETTLLAAAEQGNTDRFLSTLLLAKVLVPVRPGTPADARPGDERFGWLTDTQDGQPYVTIYTSKDRLLDHLGEECETVLVGFVQLIRHWPDKEWSFAVNPGTPVGAALPGAQIIALANWAAEVGLTGESTGETSDESPVNPAPARREAATPPTADPIMMQKVIPPGQVDYYLERGYDRVCGFVYRASELAHLRTPQELFAALGLKRRETSEAHVLRWAAYRPNLYRIPYGGQHEEGMRAMQGWVIERPPFRGNGFAPGESGDIIAEFKVDSVRLPHGAQLWRLNADGTETLLATFDADVPRWCRMAGAES